MSLFRYDELCYFTNNVEMKTLIPFLISTTTVKRCLHKQEIFFKSNLF